MKLHRSTALTTLLLVATGCDDDDTITGPGGAGSAGSGQGGTSAAGAGGDGMGGGGATGGTSGDAGRDAGVSPDAGGIPESVSLTTVASGLVAPIALRAVPDGSGRLLVAEQTGSIRVIEGGQLSPTPLLDLADRMVALDPAYDERGLLGFALHPDYASNGRAFVHYSAPLRDGGPVGFDHTSVVSEFRLEGADAGPGATERVILQVDQPQGNHNGGALAFGPDGYLYITLGDGGAADDVGAGHVEDWYEVNAGGNGQDRSANLLGSILRIDVNAAEPYAVPPDNPFAGSEQPEVWAYGFRNPFQLAFDRGGDGQLFVGDVGQNQWEEVDIVTAGGNYGWNVKEGTHCFSTETPSVALPDCPDADPDGVPLIDPIIEYASANQTGGLGLSIVGGHVYRGTALPELAGAYVFGDWSTSFSLPDGHLFVASPPAGGSGMWSVAPLAIEGRDGGGVGEFVLGLGEDAAGELYVLTTEVGAPSGTTGKVYRIER